MKADTPGAGTRSSVKADTPGAGAPPPSPSLQELAGCTGEGLHPGYWSAWLLLGLAGLFAAIHFLYLPPTPGIDVSGLVAETLLCLIPLGGLFVVQHLRPCPAIYWPMMAGLSMMLLSHLADTLDEVLVQPVLIGILIEDGLGVGGFALLILGLTRWVRFNQRMLMEIQALNASLEERVTARTATLEAEVAERQQAEGRLRDSEQRYRELNAVLEQRVAARTAEIQAANALLREREEGLEFILEGSRLGTWDWHIPSGEVRRNAYWAAMLGYTPQEVDDATADGWLALIHPADRERAWRSIDDHLAGRFPLHEVEYRMRTRDGDYRWILDRARVVSRDATGKPLRMSGTHQDITERKRDEAQLQQAREAAETANRDLQAANRALQAANSELQRLATTDRLTGVWNRHHFEEALTAENRRVARYPEQPLSLMLFDLDHFKEINDTHGHPVGDQVLVELTRRIQDHLRSVDVLARWGGEEFMVLLPHTRGEAAVKLAEKLRQLVAGEPFPEVGQVTSSFGVAEYRPHETPAQWLKRVDDALYAAKAGGRNRVCRAEAAAE